MNDKKTLVLGASPNSDRYSYKATSKLAQNGHSVLPIGIKQGKIEGIEIINESLDFEGVDTITLYLSPEKQKQYYDYIIGLKPKRIIFNPGSENAELNILAKKAGIETISACTLVMLSIGSY